MSEAILESGAAMIDQDSKPGFLKLKPVAILGSLFALGYWFVLMFSTGETQVHLLNGFMYGFVFWLMATQIGRAHV